MFHSQLAEKITPFNDALKMPDVAPHLDVGSTAGLAALNDVVTQQASIMAYGNDYKMLFCVCLAMMPLVFLLGSTRKAAGPQAQAVHALD
jgi:DHA2 family multidrug resistance protein